MPVVLRLFLRDSATNSDSRLSRCLNACSKSLKSRSALRRSTRLCRMMTQDSTDAASSSAMIS